MFERIKQAYQRHKDRKAEEEKAREERLARKKRRGKNYAERAHGKGMSEEECLARIQGVPEDQRDAYVDRVAKHSTLMGDRTRRNFFFAAMNDAYQRKVSYDRKDELRDKNFEDIRKGEAYEIQMKRDGRWHY